MEQKEIELVKRASEGYVEDYTSLVNKYSNLVFAAALGKTGDHYQAEDIAQEVFVKAWFKLSELKEPEKFIAWLLMITRNLCMDWLRKKSKTQVQSLDHDELERLPASHNPYHQADVRAQVWNVLDVLDEKYRIPAILHHMSGYQAKEISSLLGISKTAVESRLRRAKEKLKKELFDLMKETLGDKKLGKEFEDDVLGRIVPRIATIEIPVSDVLASVEWYGKILGTKAEFQHSKSAMLHLQGASNVGVPTLYLVQTDDLDAMKFRNSNTDIVHSVIDFYFPDLEKFHAFLQKENVETTGINYFPDKPTMGGFGFKDPDGHLLSVTNVTHSGQV
jgi:RNA polymerase sigma factor (sigma-70 family)